MFVVGWQAYCTAPSGKNEPSLGRRRREVGSDSAVLDADMKAENSTEEEEQVREMIEVHSIIITNSFMIHFSTLMVSSFRFILNRFLDLETKLLEEILHHIILKTNVGELNRLTIKRRI